MIAKKLPSALVAATALGGALPAQVQVQTAIGSFTVPAASPQSLSAQLLGQALFWEEQISSSGTVACGTCHRPLAGGSDPRTLGSFAARHPGPDNIIGSSDDPHGSPGVPRRRADGSYEPTIWGLAAQVTPRKSPPVINAAFFDEQFWDGRAGGVFVDPADGTSVVFPAHASLETQAADPPVSDVEMSHIGESWTAIAQRLTNAEPLALATDIPTRLAQFIQGRSYPYLFRAVFGTPDVTPVRIVIAIAAYERTLISDQSRFDDYEYGGDPTALTADEQAGLALFRSSRTQCDDCHQLPLTTDLQFHNVGLRPIAEDRGRALFVTGPDQFDDGAFRTPNLRNVALRAPFFHDGSAPRLIDVIDFYNQGGVHPTPEVDILPLGLSNQEKDQLVAFLGALTDKRLEGVTDHRLLQPPFDRPTLFTERTGTAPELFGAPSAPPPLLFPRMHMIDPWREGNSTIAFGIDRTTPGAVGYLLFDFAPNPLPGGFPLFGVLFHVGITPGMFVFPPVVYQGSAPGAGWGQIPFQLSPTTNAVGRELFAQWLTLESAAPFVVSATEGVRFRIF